MIICQKQQRGEKEKKKKISWELPKIYLSRLILKNQIFSLLLKVKKNKAEANCHIYYSTLISRVNII